MQPQPHPRCLASCRPGSRSQLSPKGVDRVYGWITYRRGGSAMRITMGLQHVILETAKARARAARALGSNPDTVNQDAKIPS